MRKKLLIAGSASAVVVAGVLVAFLTNPKSVDPQSSTLTEKVAEAEETPVTAQQATVVEQQQTPSSQVPAQTPPTPTTTPAPAPDIRTRVRADYVLSSANFSAQLEPVEWGCFSKVVDNLKLHSASFGGWDSYDNIMKLVQYAQSVQLKSYCGQDQGTLFMRGVISRYCVAGSSPLQCTW